jgi:zinc protease
VAARPAQAGVLEYTLPSGARLLIVPEHSVEIVGVAALWPGGLRAEDERTAGAHQLLARLWPRSSRVRTAEALGRELEQISGTLQPVVELDAFGLRGELLSSHLDQGLALLADCLSQPSFSEADADRERRSLIGELRGELHSDLRAAAPALLGNLEPLTPSSEATAAQLLPRDDAATAALRLFKGALLPGHPYALEPSLQSVGGLSRRRLLELFRRAYPLSKLTIAVVGDVDPQTVLERLDARLPAAPASPPPTAPVLAEPLEPRTPLQRVSYRPSQHAHMVVGFRAPGLRGPEHYAVEVLFELLAGPLGRLGRELKEKRGLAYAVQGVLELGTDLGFLALHLATSPSTFDVAQTGLREELRKLIDHPISQDELLRAQDQLVSRQAARRQRRDGHALELARAATLALPSAEASTEGYEAGVRAVSAAAVQGAARRYLDDQRAVVAAVLPESLQRRLSERPNLVELMQDQAAAPRLKGVQLASRQPGGPLGGKKTVQRSVKPERRPAPSVRPQRAVPSKAPARGRR